VPKIVYTPKKFGAESLAIIARVNAIIEEYHAQGFDLTLRQVYYQFVSRGYMPNSDRNYKRLGDIVGDARLAGLIDWEAIDDRTRHVREVGHWDEPAAIMRSAASSFRLDKWTGQPYRPEVWIEKDALVGVIAPVCSELDVPYFSCRGYTSLSSLWQASQRLLDYTVTDQEPVIFHLGDHDPSGIDMTRDIEDRMQTFGVPVPVKRLALTMDQVKRYTPPPNPAKLTDSPAEEYVAAYGLSSWELDALEPTVIATLIEVAVGAHRNEMVWTEQEEAEHDHRALLGSAATNWGDVTRGLRLAAKRPILSPQEAGAQGGRGRKRRDNVPAFGRGNSKAYLLALLERDHHALYEQVVARQMSAYQAAVQAGIRRPHGRGGAPVIAPTIGRGRGVAE